MFHLYKVQPNLKNVEPSDLVFKNKSKNTVLLEHLAEIGFEINLSLFYLRV